MLAVWSFLKAYPRIFANLLLHGGGSGIDDGNVEGLSQSDRAASRSGSSRSDPSSDTLSTDGSREGRGDEDNLGKHLEYV